MPYIIRAHTTTDPSRVLVTLGALAVKDQVNLSTDLVTGTDPLEPRVATVEAAQSSATVAYDTLSALTANTTALTGQVLADGANNGFYGRTTPNNPATAWIRKSTATIPGLDTRVTTNEGAITALKGITFATFQGVWAVGPTGNVRPMMNEWGEFAHLYPWPVQFGGYQVFPDQSGRGLGVVDPVCGFIKGLKLYGVNHNAFSWGYGPTDESGNLAYYVDRVTGTRYDRDTSTTSPYYQFIADNVDHGSNVGLMNIATGASTFLSYDEGDAKIVSVTSTIARVVTHSTYKVGVDAADPRAANKPAGAGADARIDDKGKVQSRDISLTPVAFTMGSGRTKLKLYAGRGQSDWNGTKGTPSLTTTAISAGIAKMFVGGAATAQNPGGWLDRLPDSALASIVDLREGTTPGAGNLESPMSGLAYRMLSALPSDTALLMATSAVSGNDYDLQSRGTWSFDSHRRIFLEHLRHCFLNGITPVFGAITIGWGDSDNLEGMSQADYKARMITEQIWATRVKNDLYNQLGEAKVYFAVGTPWPEFSGQPTTFKAMWELHALYPTKFRVVSSDQCRAEIIRAGGVGDPAYVHYNNEGNRRNGEVSGYCLAREEAAQTCCVAVIGATPNFASNYVDVTISLMNGSLTSDTALVSDPGNLGMYWSQTGGTTRTLSSAAIQNANNGDGTATVRLTLSGNPGSPTYWEVGAIFGQTASSRPDGPRSPLRDGSSFTALDGVTTIHPGWIVPSYYPSTGW